MAGGAGTSPSHAAGLKVVCPFVPGMLHPLADEALTEYAPQAERVDVSNSRHAYWQLLSDLWRAGRDFLVIEQDIEINPWTIPGFRACSAPWCIAPYGGPPRVDEGHEGEPAVINAGLGCTRFRASVMADTPDLLDQVAAMADNNMGAKYWQILDSRLYGLLREAQAVPHLHEPVLHHHGPHTLVNPYPRCACGGDCE